MNSRLVLILTLAWIIIIGGLMIIPSNGGIVIECIACGAALTRVLGVISILLGGVSLAMIMRQRAVG